MVRSGASGASNHASRRWRCFFSQTVGMRVLAVSLPHGEEARSAVSNHDSACWFLRSRGRLNLPLDHLQLEFGDCLGGVQSLRAGLGAVHDGVAAIEPERILEIVEPFTGGFVAAVLDPAGGLQ